MTLETYDAAVEFCSELPIYSSLEDKATTDGSRLLCEQLRDEVLQFDSYCVHCKMNTPFRSARVTSHRMEWLRITNNKIVEDGIFTLHMHCMRNYYHIYSYVFKVAGDRIFKIGQYPSLEDIARSDMEKYRDVLDAADFSELHRAGGLISHGVGIAAFVYLRRIFERLIYRHHDAASPACRQRRDLWHLEQRHPRAR